MEHNISTVLFCPKAIQYQYTRLCKIVPTHFSAILHDNSDWLKHIIDHSIP